MLLNTEERIERYDNGNIAYMETIGWIAPAWAHLYENRRESMDRKPWIRIGPNRKYWENGKLQWELLYNDHDSVVKR